MRFFAVIIALSVLGCSQVKVYSPKEKTPLSSINKVAILPFESLAGHPNAGIIMSRLLQAELESVKGLEVVPAEEVTVKVSELEGEQVEVDKLAENLGAGTLITGSVTEYGYKRGVGEEPVVGLVVKLIEPKSGRVLWSYTCAGAGSYSLLREDSLGRLSQRIASAMARSFRKEVDFEQ
ncbi:MAG: hypothetical protein ACYTFY_03245 [Planctomycetota bacterium]